MPRHPFCKVLSILVFQHPIHLFLLQHSLNETLSFQVEVLSCPSFGYACHILFLLLLTDLRTTITPQRHYLQLMIMYQCSHHKLNVGNMHAYLAGVPPLSLESFLGGVQSLPSFAGA